MAEYRLTGEAFAGTVTEAWPDRLDTSGKRAKLRPWIILETVDRCSPPPGTVLSQPDRAGQDRRRSSRWHLRRAVTKVTLQLSGGMGRSLVPQPGSVPAAGEALTYTHAARRAPAPSPGSRTKSRPRGRTAARRRSTRPPTPTRTRPRTCHEPRRPGRAGPPGHRAHPGQPGRRRARRRGRLTTRRGQVHAGDPGRRRTHCGRGAGAGRRADQRAGRRPRRPARQQSPGPVRRPARRARLRATRTGGTAPDGQALPRASPTSPNVR